MADYKSVRLDPDIVIPEIISIHYFEYMSDFYFPGEFHDFWEFLCVDKGEVIVMADETEYTLTKGDIIFHKPNEFHSVRANGVIAPNLVVMAFDCDSPAMDFFCNKIFKIGDSERMILARIVTEALHTFSSRLDDPYLTELQLREHIPFGSKQLIRSNLENLLIQFIRKETENERNFLPKELLNNPLEKSVKTNNDNQLYAQLIGYMENNIARQLTIEQICQDNLVGSSQVQKIFSERHSCGIISYFSGLKIERAKQYIRENNLNFTQISEELGYTSVHYFSRQFKKISGMTPSEYSSSIKLMTEVK